MAVSVKEISLPTGGWNRRMDVLAPRPERAKDWPTLAEARDALPGMTQQKLADQAGVSIASVRDLERNVRVRVGRRVYRSLARVLGVEGFRDLYQLKNR